MKVTIEEEKVRVKIGYTKIETRRDGFYSGNGCNRHPDCKAGYKQMKLERSTG